MADAFKSFSGSWGRYYKMALKTTAVSVAVVVALGVVMGAEALVMSYIFPK